MDLLAARPLGTFGGLQWIGRLGAKKEGVPWKRQSALSECHWEGLGGKGGLRTIDFRQLPSYYPTAVETLSPFQGARLCFYFKFRAH